MVQIPPRPQSARNPRRVRDSTEESSRLRRDPWCVVTTFVLAGLFPWEWLHPGGSGYWFYSGLFDAGILITVISGVGVYWRSHNCHVRGCWRLDWHPHPDHGHPVCRLHHPAGGAEFLDAKYHRVKVSLGATSAADPPASTAARKASRAHTSQQEHVSRNGSAVAAESSHTGGKRA
jgi:hypothetical protein